MGETAALRAKRDRQEAGGVPPQDFRAALEATLRAAADDERLAAALGAGAVRVRLEFPDLDVALSLTSEDGALEWSLAGDPGWRPQLVLAMDSAVANRFLLGRESLAIAIARGRARCRGSARVALRCLPALRLLAEPYRRILAAGYPDLLAAAG